MKKVLVLLLALLSIPSFAREVEEPSKLDEVLAKSVEKAVLVAEKTGKFVLEQAPDLLQQFYTWHIAMSIFWIVISILSFIVARYIPYLWLDKERSGYDDKYFSRYGEGAIAAWFVFAIISTSSLITCFVNIYNLLFITLAPKLYLIEYFLK